MNESSLRKIPIARAAGSGSMSVKGTAFLARKRFLEKEFGEARAAAMFDEAVGAVPALPFPILASTMVPVGAYLAFQDELCKRHYHGDPMAFFRFGEASAEWSMTAGPHKRLLENKDFATFVTQGEVFYRNYFDVGSARTAVEGDVVSFRIEGVPPQFRHVYLEYAPIGYFKRALELVGSSKLAHRRIRGFSSHDADVHYELFAAK